MRTFATLFSGGELAGVGMQAAGLRHLWGIEKQADIAAVAAANGMPAHVADILDVDPHGLEAPYALHASPVCTRASNANQSAEKNDEGTKEAPTDIAMAEKVAQFIDVLKPHVFTLENVYAYRNFRAFGIITAALSRGGYFWDYDHLNSANFSVPQTRRRLVLRAVHGRLLPNLPAPEPWVGWYAAIEDLIPDLPASKFAPWQLARLPALLETTLVERHGAFNLDDKPPQTRGVAEPVWTVRGSDRQLEMATAFILAGGGNTNLAEAEPGRGVRYGGEPMHSVTPVTSAGGTMPRAWLVQGTSTLDIRRDDEPSAVVMATVHEKAARPRAFLVDGQNSRPDTGEPTVRHAGEPAMTVAASVGHRPANAPRAWLSTGRVVSMTPRALMRFQSGPDWYVLPDKPSLACRVIGNGCPPLMFEKLYRGLVTEGAA